MRKYVGGRSGLPRRSARGRLTTSTADASRVLRTRQLWRIGSAKSTKVCDGTFEINAFVQELSHLMQLVLHEALGRQAEGSRDQLDRSRDGILVAFEQLHEVSRRQAAASLIQLSGGARELAKAQAELLLASSDDVRESLL